MTRHARIRRQNERLAAGARRHHFDDLSPVPFLCECDDNTCREFVSVVLPTFESLREKGLHLLAAGHDVRAGGRSKTSRFERRLDDVAEADG